MLLFGCQSPDNRTGPTPSDGAAAGSARPDLEWVLSFATPPGMPKPATLRQSAVEGSPTFSLLRRASSVAAMISPPTDLGLALSMAHGINASGQVVGSAIDEANGSRLMAVRWSSDATPATLQTPNADDAVALDLNDGGVVVGYDVDYDQASGTYRTHAARWGSDGSYSQLPNIPSYDHTVSEAINKDGIVVGYVRAQEGPPRAVRWDGVGIHVLSEEFSVALGVNETGTAVGYVNQYPVKWSGDGTLTILPLPQGTTSGRASGINKDGQVVGLVGYDDGTEYPYRAVLWAADGTPTMLPSREGAIAVAINDEGVVAGLTVLGYRESVPRLAGVLWTDGEPTSVPGGGSFLNVEVRDISSNQLAGTGFLPDFGADFHAVRWSFIVPAVHFEFTGFSLPVQNPGSTAPYIVNKVKAGQAVPIRFSLNGDQGLDILASGNPRSKAGPCTLINTEGGQPTKSTGARRLSYAPRADQYSYIWKTEKAWAGTCRQLMISLTDGTTHTALFKFK
jgi:uncharacterized membrane protein